MHIGKQAIALFVFDYIGSLFVYGDLEITFRIASKDGGANWEIPGSDYFITP